MLTPQNFREKAFEKAIFGGYDTSSVDDFLDEAANDYAALAKENMVLKSKMKVLVEKIEEYRATEDSMRLTLLSAQRLSQQIEQDARDKSDEALTSARAEAERITREAYTQRATEEGRLLEAKRESTQYIENMRLLCSKQLDFLDNLQDLKLEEVSRRPSHSDSVEETVRSIENSVEHLAESGDASEEVRRVVTNSVEAPLSGADEPTRPYAAGGASTQGKQFSMDNLRFGK